MPNMLILLLRIEFTDIIAEQMQLKKLLEQGVNLVIFDLSSFNKSYLVTDAKPSDIYHVEKIKNSRELALKIKNTSSDAIFLDYIYGLFGIKADRFTFVFRLLKKYNARYYIVARGTLPNTTIGVYEKKSWVYNSICRLKLLMKRPQILAVFFNTFITSLKNKIIDFLVINRYFFQVPCKVFSNRNDILEHYLTLYRLSKSIHIPIHSSDYEQYLLFNQCAKFSSFENTKFCVFIDNCYAHHPDFLALPKVKRPVTHESYHESLNCFFDHVERVTGLKVIIAAHPRSNYEHFPGVFRGRNIILGQTLELVRAASFVICHDTTAISYAVLYNKPIGLLLTDEMIKARYDRNINLFSQRLGVHVFKIDQLNDADTHVLAKYDSLSKNYDEYKYNYIQSNGIKDVLAWDCVLVELNKENL